MEEFGSHKIGSSALDLIQVLLRTERKITERLLSPNWTTEAVMTNVLGSHVLAFQRSSCKGARGGSLLHRGQSGNHFELRLEPHRNRERARDQA